MKIKREYSITLLVLSGVVLLIFGVNFLKGLDLFQKRNVYHAVYHDVSGISGASPVFYHGYKVGQVIGTALMLDGTGRVAISFQVNEDALSIPEDTKVQIYSVDLFSRALKLDMGQSGRTAEAGDTLVGDAQLSLTDAVSEQIDPLKAKAENMIASVDSVLNTFQQMLNPQAVGDIDSSFSSIRRALESLSNAAERLDRLVATESASIGVTIHNLETVSTTFAENSDEIDNIFNNLDTLTAELAYGRMRVVLDKLAAASTELHTITADINSGKGSMGKLLKEDSLYNNLNSASLELDLLMEDFRLNPNRYVQLSLFGKKDKLPKLSNSDIDRISRSLQEQKKP
jgi:phospholipid/cholesterol/gamma-HCH transport system substrate-binding protein